MALSPQQRQRVAWLKDGYLEEPDDYDEAAFEARWEQHFAAISSPEELFLFASESHPAQEPHEWRRVLDHPLCDMGTALLVFWRQSPAFYYKYANRDAVEQIFREKYDLVMEIERKYLAGEYPHAVVRFDPGAFKGINFIARPKTDQLHRLPRALLQPSPGEPVPQLAKEDFEWGPEFAA